jgi:hypothetical protein
MFSRPDVTPASHTIHQRLIAGFLALLIGMSLLMSGLANAMPLAALNDSTPVALASAQDSHCHNHTDKAGHANSLRMDAESADRDSHDDTCAHCAPCCHGAPPSALSVALVSAPAAHYRRITSTDFSSTEPHSLKRPPRELLA